MAVFAQLIIVDLFGARHPFELKLACISDLAPAASFRHDLPDELVIIVTAQEVSVLANYLVVLRRIKRNLIIVLSDFSLLALPLCLASHMNRRDDKLEGFLSLGIDYRRLVHNRDWNPFRSDYWRWTESYNSRSVQLPLIVSLPGRHFFDFFLLSYYSEPILVLILIPCLLQMSLYEQLGFIA